MLEKLQSLARRLIPSRHVRHGLPFLTFLVVGWLGIREFAQIRYDMKKKYGESTAFQERAEQIGKGSGSKKTTLEEEYQKMVLDKDIDSWFNIRGPRPEENSRAMQDEIREKHSKSQTS